PKEFEEVEAAFCHTPSHAMPEWTHAGVRGRVLIGEAFGLRSPVRTFAPTLYLDVFAEPGASLTLPPDAQHTGFERAVYSIDNGLRIDDIDVPPFNLAVLQPDTASTIAAPEGARYVVIGGEPLDGPRIIWWNFVSSSAERIERAKEDWANQ